MSDRAELSGFGAGKEAIRGRNRKKVGGEAAGVAVVHT